MKKFIAQPSFWELFPGASFGVVVARSMKLAAEVPPEDAHELARLLKRANAVAERHLTSDVISENEAVAVWRDAYRRFKTKGGARSSMENLLKRTLKGRPVGSIAPAVDIYNAVSLTWAFPVGGEDVDALAGDMRLGITQGGDAFRALGEDKDEPTLPGELCYLDEVGAVCRCWNWRDGQRTALTDTTRNAFLIVENCQAERQEDCAAAADELAGLVERYLGAEIAVKQLVCAERPELVIG